MSPSRRAGETQREANTMTIVGRGVAVSLLATLLAVSGTAWAGPPEQAYEVSLEQVGAEREQIGELEREQIRVGQIEQRLAAVAPQGQGAAAVVSAEEQGTAAVATVSPEVQGTVMAVDAARRMLELSQRYLNAENAAAARLHNDLAERFTALAEGKAVQP
jgi:hypothetical protein